MQRACKEGLDLRMQVIAAVYEEDGLCKVRDGAGQDVCMYDRCEYMKIIWFPPLLVVCKSLL